MGCHEEVSSTCSSGLGPGCGDTIIEEKGPLARIGANGRAQSLDILGTTTQKGETA